MKLRSKTNPNNLASSSSFNVHGLGEIIVGFPNDGGMDSDYITNYEVYLEKSHQ